MYESGRHSTLEVMLLCVRRRKANSICAAVCLVNMLYSLQNYKKDVEVMLTHWH